MAIAEALNSTLLSSMPVFVRSWCIQRRLFLWEDCRGTRFVEGILLPQVLLSSSGGFLCLYMDFVSGTERRLPIASYAAVFFTSDRSVRFFVAC